ncbi:hypothetical protein Oweho_2349 [Owenweeksia hongkongensis DSM 17368]|uniref:Uncharacterized protein n=1 Tax=Owenweeksia hongkongensis (strain DSM 17368 / CIP 108786 / JCM 12287 / NRRL B-23963 / UST20020801) TaxID=926562 RepID=G8R6A0_OWEHD|nr:hypothetical protein [Owenweeksia hongkongensis]AEV33320.1 hypothetical protein Oweho_2349 [Owenweeksia hongkongensis DSM 17368]
MKKIFFPLIILSLALIFSCKKEDLDPEYPFTIVVKTYDDSISVANVNVEVFTPVQGNTVDMLGITDQNGKVSFTYDQNAVLLIRATRGANPFAYMGCADIRLEPNERVTKTVYLEVYDPNVPGCVYSP